MLQSNFYPNRRPCIHPPSNSLRIHSPRPLFPGPSHIVKIQNASIRLRSPQHCSRNRNAHRNSPVKNVSLLCSYVAMHGNMIYPLSWHTGAQMSHYESLELRTAARSLHVAKELVCKALNLHTKDARIAETLDVRYAEVKQV
jgi:hypothetical protein